MNFSFSLSAIIAGNIFHAILKIIFSLSCDGLWSLFTVESFKIKIFLFNHFFSAQSLKKCLRIYFRSTIIIFDLINMQDKYSIFLLVSNKNKSVGLFFEIKKAEKKWKYISNFESSFFYKRKIFILFLNVYCTKPKKKTM
jgi:hypothetical protein